MFYSASYTKAWKELFIKILQNKNYLDVFTPSIQRSFSDLEEDLRHVSLNLLKIEILMFEFAYKS